MSLVHVYHYWWSAPEAEAPITNIEKEHATLIDSRSRRRSHRENAQCITELAERTIESPRDRARFESRLARVREASESQSVDQHLVNPSKHEE